MPLAEAPPGIGAIDDIYVCPSPCDAYTGVTRGDGKRKPADASTGTEVMPQSRAPAAPVRFHLISCDPVKGDKPVLILLCRPSHFDETAPVSAPLPFIILGIQPIFHASCGTPLYLITFPLL